MIYRIVISKSEVKALEFSADRYESAAYLYDAMRHVAGSLDDDDPDLVFEIDESEAHGYIDELGCDYVKLIVPPLLGGELADKLVALYESIE